jgi:hypothetical protein
MTWNVWEIGSVKLVTECGWVVSFTPRLIYPTGNNVWCLLCRRLDGPQNRSGRCGAPAGNRVSVDDMGWVMGSLCFLVGAQRILPGFVGFSPLFRALAAAGLCLQCRMVGWSTDWKGSGRKQSWPNKGASRKLPGGAQGNVEGNQWA